MRKKPLCSHFFSLCPPLPPPKRRWGFVGRKKTKIMLSKEWLGNWWTNLHWQEKVRGGSSLCVLSGLFLASSTRSFKPPNSPFPLKLYMCFTSRLLWVTLSLDAVRIKRQAQTRNSIYYFEVMNLLIWYLMWSTRNMVKIFVFFLHPHFLISLPMQLKGMGVYKFHTCGLLLLLIK